MINALLNLPPEQETQYTLYSHTNGQIYVDPHGRHVISQNKWAIDDYKVKMAGWQGTGFYVAEYQV